MLGEPRRDVPRTCRGIAANTSSRDAAARRTKKPTRTAGETPAFASPRSTAGAAASDERGGGNDEAATIALASSGGSCSGSASGRFAGLGFFAAFLGFLVTGRGLDSAAGEGVGATLGSGVAAGGAGSGTGAGSGAGCASADPTAPRVTATAIVTTRDFEGRLRRFLGRGQRKDAPLLRKDPEHRLDEGMGRCGNTLLGRVLTPRGVPRSRSAARSPRLHAFLTLEFVG